ncbi:cation/calcium exchanger 1-like [Vigna unguiculata]|uniref:cation/calcium exchanger 1-like n=1 Tax=Vigna unguiculata TaxID=3917 RepID=UPI001015F872|nr:cation/calcium exchanger 1-like [Vigna unguiculata]
MDTNSRFLLHTFTPSSTMAPFIIFNSKLQSRVLVLVLNLAFIFLFCLLLNLYLHPPNSDSQGHSNASLLTIFNHARLFRDVSVEGCTDIHKYSDFDSKCLYVKSNLECRSKGYINYLQIFYCNSGKFPILGQTLLALWLIVLFYLLGDTASNYFCSSLEGLSNILRLSPTIAGVTLLSLGNGAPDFFASVVSFSGSSSNGAVGLNSILGGSFFVSCVVLGVISILVSPNQVEVEKASFIRDVLFFLLSLFILLIIIYIGKITLFASICYVSIYFLYVCAVSATHLIYGKDTTNARQYSMSCEESLAPSIPLLGYVDEEKQSLAEIVVVEDKDQNQKHKPASSTFGDDNNSFFDWLYFGKLLQLLELPLCLPRRLTIPVVSKEKWSKPFAVISVTLAPVLLAVLFNTQSENVASRSSIVTYIVAALIGIVLGNMACVTTDRCSPPTKSLFPWLAGGFAMSVTWTYIIAAELVSVLVSIGSIVGVSPSVLGLTVLAWGNSLGDFIANGAMALNGGADGVQMAISGCYAGPMFNTLMGLGLPLVLSALSDNPDPYVIPKDPSLYATLLFLMGGLLWALVILPKKSMKLDKSLGVGLLSVYLCFLVIRIALAFGVVKF